MSERKRDDGRNPSFAKKTSDVSAAFAKRQLGQQSYELPLDAEPCFDDVKIPLEDSIVLHECPKKCYKNMVVDFSVILDALAPDARSRHNFHEIDSKHGTIHHHRFRRCRKLPASKIVKIPNSDWNFVNEAFYQSVDWCFSHYEDEYARWCKTF
ncbi:hypothetical protein OZX72_05340 [Bifidobacterium sp. ESL0769]|uniref:hypothetical protein n=1 Tax=Bifidobacterium sp. ESL0769 TaxID=2983229 RepID=UPI0023F871B4|nr:hypothetical protein [Bifidobacterium sp. ESL0769]WEV66698.1 hypothetical protein OZX72_05340 [Bifidobacterium sp. ESL0769]